MPYKYSSSSGYLNSVRADNILNGGKWPSEYAENSFNDRITTRPYAAYSDDFAESIRLYLVPETEKGMRFRMLFPNRAEFIKNFLGV